MSTQEIKENYHVLQGRKYCNNCNNEITSNDLCEHVVCSDCEPNHWD